jgi:hypothetical protein
MRAIIRKLAFIALFIMMAIIGVQIVARLSTTPPATVLTATTPALAKPTPIGGGTGEIAFVAYQDARFHIYTIRADNTDLLSFA